MLRSFFFSVWIIGDGSESPVLRALALLLRCVHYGAGDVGDGDIGGGSGGDGARASEGRSLVLNACPASGLLSLVRVRVRARVRTGVWARVGVRVRVRVIGFGLGLGAMVRVRVICAEDRTGY